MKHVDEGTLQSLLDDELSAADRMTVQSHLVACTECANEVDELRASASELRSALSLIDVQRPIPMLRARVDVDPVVQQVERSRMGWRRLPASLARAAALVLLIAGAASAAIPGSPVQRWVLALFEGPGESAETPDQQALPVTPEERPEAAAPAPAGNAGYEVAPANGVIRVEIHSPVEGTRIEVRVVDDVIPRATVLGDADIVVFQSAAGRMEFSNVDARGLVIELPRSLERGSVLVDGQLLYEVENGRGRAVAPAAQADAERTIFRTGS